MITASWPVTCYPQRAQHHPRRRVQPRPRLHQRLIGEHVHRLQASTGIHRTGFGHRQRPPTVAIVIDAQPQHRMPIQQRLQHHDHIGFGHPRRSRHHHRLVELIHRAIHAGQPAHDRGRQHRPDTLINRPARSAGHPGHPGQPGDGLLDENVTRPAHQPGSPGPSHHLHRQDAVPAQIEERVIDPDPLQPQHLRVDAGQDLLNRGGRGAVLGAILVLRCRQGAHVKLAVGCDRQCVHHHHRGRHHVGRQPLGQRAAQLDGVDCAGGCFR